MKSLNNNTLENLSKYSDKTFKLFQYMNLSGQDFIIDQIAKTGQNNSEIEMIEAFRKDIQETAKLIKKAQFLLSVVDEYDRVLHLKGGVSNDLKEVFGDSYDPRTKSINFGKINIPLLREVDQEDIENQLYKNTLNISKSDYDVLFKSRKNIYKYSEDSLSDEEEKIAFLSIIGSQEYYQPVLEKIKSYQKEFNSYRSGLTEDEKKKIDNEITFNRSMVDSVTKQSTYITRDDINQIASGHKKEKDLLLQIQKRLKSSKYVKSVELDKDTSLENFISLLDQIDSVKLNLKNEIVLKVRKLGNYNANGLYFPSQKIVAVDLSQPSSMIHELTHAVDYSDFNIHNSQVRRETIEHFKNKIDKTILPEGKEQYYLSSVEIIARLGEVTYLFEKFKYNENEGMENFIDRVKKEQIQKNASDLSMIKPIERYMNNIYFNIDHWNEADIKKARSFYSMFYNVDNNDIKPIDDIIIEHESAKVIGKRVVTRYEETSTSLFTPDTIKRALDYNKENNIVSTEYLLRRIINRPCEIGKTKKAFSQELAQRQIDMLKKVGEWVNEQDNPFYSYVVMSEIYNVNTYKNGVLNVAKAYNVINSGAEKDFDLDGALRKGEELHQEKQKIYEEIRHRQMTENFSTDLINLSQEARREVNRAKRFPLNEQEKFLNQFSNDSLKNGYSNHIEAYTTQKDPKKGNKHLNNYSIGLYTKPIIKAILPTIEKYGFDSILSFADKNENLITTLGIETAPGNKLLNTAINEYVSEKDKHGQVSKTTLFKDNLSAYKFIGYFDKVNLDEPQFNLLSQDLSYGKETIKKIPINLSTFAINIQAKFKPMNIEDMDLKTILDEAENLEQKYKDIHDKFTPKAIEKKKEPIVDNKKENNDNLNDEIEKEKLKNNKKKQEQFKLF